jgi:hypothetical protein
MTILESPRFELDIQMKRFFLVLTISFLSSCAGSSATKVEESSPSKLAQICCAGCINPNLGKLSEVKGTLENTKLAPSILSKGFRVYCLGSTLPEGTIGKKVVAKGHLEYTDQFTAQKAEGTSNNLSQGTEGNDLVLRDCELRLLESNSHY